MKTDPGQLHVDFNLLIQGLLNQYRNDVKDVAVVDDYSDITLRPLLLSDAEDFTEWYTDEKVAEFCWDVFNRESAIEYVAKYIIPQRWQRAICLKGKPVGLVTVAPFRGHDACRAEIGYLLSSKYWGKGIATRAVKMAARTVFRQWPRVGRIEGIVDVDNIASQKVLLKAGFTKEAHVLRKYALLKGKPRDMVMFSLLSTDPL